MFNLYGSTNFICEVLKVIELYNNNNDILISENHTGLMSLLYNGHSCVHFK